ncbi:MAG: hypothetical protein ACD_46C00181G0025 [uncultured bacterium]|nr:MAG: hypothetical protein ACD_46C00181G0025 [uncultured bacterium]
MIENHNICDFSVFNESFEPFNYLGHRDKQVVRQCIQNFSAVVGLVRSNGSVPKVLETGAGLSTIIFSKLLNLSGEHIKTIDAFAIEAIQLNSRGTGDHFKLTELRNCDIVKGVTIDFDELDKFYQSKSSTIMSLSSDQVLSNLDLFFNFNMEDRNYKKVSHIIKSNHVISSKLKNYFIENSLFANELIKAYRTDNDEFNFLKSTQSKPILRDTLQYYSPNIIYLDSGEFSSVIEFNIIDELTQVDTLLIVQDIFFPKSIKSFLISSAILSSNRWRVLWIDRTTPQGMLICKKYQ